MLDNISENQAISHKGERRQKCSMEFKKALLNTLRKILSIVQQRNSKSIEKKVREWVQKEEKVTSMKEKRFRLDGGGRKLTDVELEEVLSWIQQQRLNMLCVSKKLIIFKAKSIYDEKCGDNEELKAGFVASNGWLTKFMKRNNLSM